MSRTVFAERFREALGTTPNQYLTEWRMQQARRLLSESRTPVSKVAVTVGYDSAAAFSRAYRRVTGSPPGRYRKRHRSCV